MAVALMTLPKVKASLQVNEVKFVLIDNYKLKALKIIL